MNEFTVEIKETSIELSKKDRVRMKDPSNAIKLDEVTNEGSFVFKPEFYVMLAIHNPKSDNPDYTNIMIVDDNGTKYVTGSPSFITAFKEIWDEMESPGDWEIECFKRDSKNYKGKQFLTCSIV